MNIATVIKQAGISLDECVIVGSGILCVLGIRTANDVDIIVSDKVYDNLLRHGWEKANWPDQEVLHKDDVEICKVWDNKSFDQLKQGAVAIDGAYFLSLEDLRKWKLLRARRKDLEDIKLIDAYLKSHD